MEFSNKAIFVLLGVLLLGSGLVMAIPAPAQVGTQTFLTRWEAGPADTVTTEGGNISVQGITAGNTLTEKWAGFFGNLTAGGVILADNDSGNSLYEWSGSIDGSVVCLTSGTTFDWANAQAGTGANVDAQWGFTATDIDSGTNTVGTGGCNVYFIGPGTINGNVINHAAGSFDTCVLGESNVSSKDDMAFCVNADDSGTSYTGAAANYELMVPTSEGVGPGPAETYYVYVEVA